MYRFKFPVQIFFFIILKNILAYHLTRDCYNTCCSSLRSNVQWVYYKTLCQIRMFSSPVSEALINNLLSRTFVLFF